MAAKHPNIVLILVDELRYDCLGYAGNADVQTPHLDQLAERGVNFSETICSCPISAPSRTSLWTGQYPSSHRVNDNHTGLPTNILTLPRCLKVAGYRTAAVGKMHFIPPYRTHGFDVLRLAEQAGPGRHVDDYHRYLESIGKRDDIDWWDQVNRDAAPPEFAANFGAMVSNLTEEEHSTTWIGNEALNVLKGFGREPFFLACSFIKPHHPFDPPAPWHEMYDPAALRLPKDYCYPIPEFDECSDSVAHFPLGGLTEESFRKVLAFYYATISHVDMQVGRILDWLESEQRTEDTIVAFTGDHGDYMGQHGLILKTGPRVYDSLVRVPLLVAGVHDQLQGHASEALAESVDIMPTLLDAAGVQTPRRIEGRSLLPVLLGERDDSHHRKLAYCDHGGLQMVRSRQWKLVWGRRHDDHAMYNLESDPEEFTNLYWEASFSERREELLDGLMRMLVAHQEHAKVWTRDAGYSTDSEILPRT